MSKIKIPERQHLWPFQEESIPTLMARKHNLLADDMGLGKTMQAITLINSLDLKKVLIICPASVKRNWERKLREWLVEQKVVQIIDKRMDVVSDLAEIVIVNYDLVTYSWIHQQLREALWDLLICDESHRLKSLDAKRTHSVLAKNGLVRSALRTLMMTGTPVLNRPVELFPILRVLAPEVISPYNDYRSFTQRYCDAWQDGFGWNAKGASHIDELNKKLRQHYMIRRLTHEVEVQLPKKRYEVVFIDPTPGVKQKLTVLDQACRKDFKYQHLGLDGGQLAVLRRDTAEEKVSVSSELIRNYAESAGKLVIFAYHHSVINKLERQLADLGVVTLTGETAQKIRQRHIDAFRKTEKSAPRVFIGQIQASGEGIDGLQDVCNNVLFVESSWVPGEIEQALKRVHRIGQTKPVLIRFLVWAGSVEEHMLRVALDKVKVIKEVLK